MHKPSFYVQQSAAAKNISAWVILNPRGKHVATVKMLRGRRVLINVSTTSAAKHDPGFQAYRAQSESEALAGVVIDGHIIADHCSREGAPKPPKGRHTFPTDYKPKKGYRLSNLGSWNTNLQRDDEHGEYGWRDCYKIGGLGYLTALGYQVIQVI